MNPTTVYLPSINDGGEEVQPMEHHEAVAMMASERYLLGELTPELRDAYEEHLFDCAECAADVKAGHVFLDHAKVVLPGMIDNAGSQQTGQTTKRVRDRRDWFAWMRPALLVPAFASLLAVIAYQNFVTYPALETAANEPRLLPWTTLHPATRGDHQVILANEKQGAVLLVNVPQDAAYGSYAFDLYDAQGKQVWTHVTSSADNPDGSWSLLVPGGVFTSGSYKLTVLGVTSGGEKIPLQQSMFDLQIKK